jgi:hypothetical protein
MDVRESVTRGGHDLGAPGHISAFFDSREEGYDVLVPYYAEGIGQGGRVIAIVGGDTLDEHRARLASRGVPVEEATESGGLQVLT